MTGSECNKYCSFELSTLFNHDEYFQMRLGVVGRIGLLPLQKCIATIHILAYRSSINCVDEYVRIDECTVTQCYKNL